MANQTIANFADRRVEHRVPFKRSTGLVSRPACNVQKHEWPPHGRTSASHLGERARAPARHPGAKRRRAVPWLLDHGLCSFELRMPPTSSYAMDIGEHAVPVRCPASTAAGLRPPQRNPSRNRRLPSVLIGPNHGKGDSATNLEMLMLASGTRLDLVNQLVDGPVELHICAGVRHSRQGLPTALVPPQLI